LKGSDGAHPPSSIWGGVDTGKTKPIDPAQSRAANARMRYINSISPGTSSETPKNPTEWGGAVRTKSMERGAERRDSLPGARGDLATGGSNQRGPKMGERGSPRKHFNIPGDRYGPPQTIGDSPLTDLIRHRKKLTGDERTRRAIERNKNDLRRGRIY